MDEGRQYGRVFLPATLDDNPHIDRESYIKSLGNLDPITLRQLLKGDWSARHGGSMFQREWFEVVDEAPRCVWERRWDLAATKVRPGKDPDWTAGALVGLSNGVWYIADIKRIRETPGAVEDLIKQTAQLDSTNIRIRMEQEPGASGVNTIDTYQRKVLVGFNFLGIRSTGSKVVRAQPFSAAAYARNVKLVRGPWIGAFLDEAEGFPEGGHDDMIDAVSGAMADLTGGYTAPVSAGPKKTSSWQD